MSDFHNRVWRSAENIFTGALGAFEAQRWYFAEIMAAEVMGLCMFLMNDPETPEHLKDRAEVFGLQAKDFTKKARAAWIGERLKPRLQGRSRMESEIDREMEAVWDETGRAVKDAVIGEE